ncbi:MAG TPA: hypothetical protein VFK06_13095, partial [Candidatus Angelobacter sp.]|nr:hypothetical protein [Candidatus Angelobacter sp.]
MLISTGLAGTLAGNGANGTHSVDLSGFQDGTVTVAISATDTAGNAANGSGDSATLDTTADVGTDLSVSFGDHLVNNIEKTNVSYTVDGVDGDAAATVTFSGILISTGLAGTLAGNGANGTHSVDLSVCPGSS